MVRHAFLVLPQKGLCIYRSFIHTISTVSSSTNRHPLARLRRLLYIINIDLGDLSV